MLLITEFLEDTTKCLVEQADDGSKKLYIEGVFMQANRKNRNGRIYPKDVLAEQVRQYNENFVRTNRALGELNHPQSPVVNPERASHRIVALKESGNDFYGKALVLNTPMGNIVRGLIEGGTQIGVSSRGLGTLKANKDGINEVQSDFKLICVDVVADPSAPDAFVNGIMEGREWVWENGAIREEDVARAKKRILYVSKRALEEEKLRVFKQLVSGIRVDL